MNNLSEQVGRQVVFIQDLEAKLAALRSSDHPANVAAVAAMAAPTYAAPVASYAQPSPVPTVHSYALPWANANPRVTVPFMMRLPEELHAKLTWLKENMPNTSIQKIVRIAIEKEVAELLAKHLKS